MTIEGWRNAMNVFMTELIVILTHIIFRCFSDHSMFQILISPFLFAGRRKYMLCMDVGCLAWFTYIHNTILILLMHIIIIIIYKTKCVECLTTTSYNTDWKYSQTSFSSQFLLLETIITKQQEIIWTTIFLLGYLFKY